ncbi:MAG: hypothetical protein DMG71_16250 [Acidobacteria bacterium]|nr:MAG: hypothetical protein DMG71_16250 [Acidobacteriota bacterium]
MSVNSILPQMPASQAQSATERSDPPISTPHGRRDVQDQNQDVKAGNVTSAEKISPDVKVDAVDSRKEDLERRTRRRRLDTKA